MKTEKGVIIVAYQKSLRNHRYLVLKRKKNWEGWELVKGHLEDENYNKTVKIELEEEAGIKESQIKNIEDLEKTVSWSYTQNSKKYEKKYKAYKVEVSKEAIVDTRNNPDNEHETGFFLDYKDAKSLLEYENNRKLLEQVHNQLN